MHRKSTLRPLPLAVLILIIFSSLYLFSVYGASFSSTVANPPTTAMILQAGAANQLLNFSVNNTDFSQNITLVNISLPLGFNFTANSNGTSVSDNTFTNSTSQNISWPNTTASGIIENGTAQYFWFNSSVPATPANYSFNITTLDTAGVLNWTLVNVSVKSITVTETIVPSIVNPGDPINISGRATLNPDSTNVANNILSIWTNNTLAQVTNGDAAGSTETSDTDFGAGTNSQTAVIGTGTAANVTLAIDTSIARPDAPSCASGTDHLGADWQPANNSNISGCHYNINNFIINSTTVVYVAAYDGSVNGTLNISAANINISGILNGDAKGYLGGAPSGNSGVNVGSYGNIGGPGGAGGYYLGGLGPSYGDTGGTSAGSVYGTASGSDIGMGGGAGSGGTSDNNVAGGGGNPGGGSILLYASDNISISGTVSANGGAGGDGGSSNDPASWMGAGGGGGAGAAGGGILVNGDSVTLNGTLRANGGAGGSGGSMYIYVDDAWQYVAYGDSGNLGGGGRIKIFYNSLNTTGATITATGYNSGTIRLVTYYSSGNFTSQIKNIQNSGWGVMNWTSVLPANTNLTMKVRTSNSATMSSAPAWSTCQNITSGADISGGCVTDTDRYIQYLATMSSDTLATPVLSDVTINYATTKTNSTGGYNYTFTAPWSYGTYSVKVNLTNADGIYGENTVSLSTTKDCFVNISGASGSSCDYNLCTITGGTAIMNGTCKFVNVNITSTGILTHPQGYALNLSADNLTIFAGGKIDATGKGYLNDSGPGAGTYYSGFGNAGGFGGGLIRLNISGTLTNNGSILASGTNGLAGSFGASGGGYGSRGGRGNVETGGSAYGSIIAPNDFGSGGGSATLSTRCSGGGSGGGIYIETSTFAGNGIISANGGVPGSQTSPCGGGGGGRIAIYYNSKTFSGNINAKGGANTYLTDQYSGGAGTIYLKQSGQNGELIIHNDVYPYRELIYDRHSNTTINETLTLSNLSLMNVYAIIPSGKTVTAQNSGVWDLLSNVELSVNGDFALPSVTDLSVNGTLALNNNPGRNYTFNTLSVPGTLTIGAGTNITAMNSGSWTMPGSINVGGDLALPSVTDLNVSGTLNLSNAQARNYSFSTLTIPSGGTLTIGAGTNITAMNSGSWTIGGTLSVYGGGGFNASNVDNLTISGTFSITNSTTTVLSSLKNLTINSGGTLTHAANNNTQVYSINLSLENLVINSGGKIDAAGKGYAGGAPGTTGYGPGGGTSAGGGGYGGYGGYGGAAAYGNLSAPIALGSGGSSVASGTGYGGAGGGMVLLNISGTLALNGLILANGSKGEVQKGAGGSGGSAYITASAFTGNGGIYAYGGDSDTGGLGSRGGGGGGRIAIYYGAKTFSGAITAYGGAGYSGAQYGGAGTIYLENTQTDYKELLLDNNNNAGAQTPINDTITLNNLTAQKSADAIITSGKAVTVSSGNILIASTLTVDTSAVLNATNTNITVSGTLTANNLTTFPTSNMTIVSGGTLNHAANTNSRLYYLNMSLDNLVINSGGKIDVSGKGYSSANGPGKGADLYGNGGYDVAGGAGGGLIIIVSNNLTNNGAINANGLNGDWGNWGASGGGYGGIGGEGTSLTGGNSYGSITNPIDFGSGGGRSESDYSYGGGGGSGGTVYINASTFAGSGSVSAIGGSQGTTGIYSSGGGGGGRIAIYYYNKTFSGTISAYGYKKTDSNYRYSGGSGTIFQKNMSSQAYGDLLIDNNGAYPTSQPINAITPLNSSAYSTAFDTLTIQNGGKVSSALSVLPLNATTIIVNNGSITLTTNSINIRASNISMPNSGNIASTSGNINITLPNSINSSNFAGTISASSGSINIWYGATPQDRCDISGATISGTMSYYYARWSNTTAYRCVKSVILDTYEVLDSSNTSRTQLNTGEQFYPSVRIREYNGTDYFNVGGSWTMEIYNSNGSVPNATYNTINTTTGYWKTQSVYSESTATSYSFYSNISGTSAVGMANYSNASRHAYSIKGISIIETISPTLADPGGSVNISGKAVLMPDGTDVTNRNASIFIDSIFQGNATTNSTGGYNYTFTAPLTAGNHTVKVNITDANGIYGWNQTNLDVMINLSSPGAKGTTTGNENVNVNENVNLSVTIPTSNINYPNLNISKVWANVSNSTWSQVYFLSGNVSGRTWWNATFSSASFGTYNITFYANLTDGFNYTMPSNTTFNIKQLNITYNINDTIIYSTEIAMINGTVYLEPEHAISASATTNITVNGGTTDKNGTTTDGSGNYNFTYIPNASVTSITSLINFTINSTNTDGIRNYTSSPLGAITVYPIISVNVIANQSWYDIGATVNATATVFYGNSLDNSEAKVMFEVIKDGYRYPSNATVNTSNWITTDSSGRASYLYTFNESGKYYVKATANNSIVNSLINATAAANYAAGRINATINLNDTIIYSNEKALVYGSVYDWLNASWAHNSSAVTLINQSGTLSNLTPTADSAGGYNSTYTPPNVTSIQAFTISANATDPDMLNSSTIQATIKVYPTINISASKAWTDKQYYNKGENTTAAFLIYANNGWSLDGGIMQAYSNNFSSPSYVNLSERGQNFWNGTYEGNYTIQAGDNAGNWTINSVTEANWGTVLTNISGIYINPYKLGVYSYDANNPKENFSQTEIVYVRVENLAGNTGPINATVTIRDSLGNISDIQQLNDIGVGSLKTASYQLSDGAIGLDKSLRAGYWTATINATNGTDTAYRTDSFFIFPDLWNPDTSASDYWEYRLMLTLDNSRGIARNNVSVKINGSEMSAMGINMSTLNVGSIRIIDPDANGTGTNEVEGRRISYYTNASGTFGQSEYIAFAANISENSKKIYYLYYSTSNLAAPAYSSFTGPFFPVSFEQQAEASPLKIYGLATDKGIYRFGETVYVNASIFSPSPSTKAHFYFYNNTENEMGAIPCYMRQFNVIDGNGDNIYQTSKTPSPSCGGFGNWRVEVRAEVDGEIKDTRSVNFTMDQINIPFTISQTIFDAGTTITIWGNATRASNGNIANGANISITKDSTIIYNDVTFANGTFSYAYTEKTPGIHTITIDSNKTLGANIIIAGQNSTQITVNSKAELYIQSNDTNKNPNDDPTFFINITKNYADVAETIDLDFEINDTNGPTAYTIPRKTIIVPAEGTNSTAIDWDIKSIVPENYTIGVYANISTWFAGGQVAGQNSTWFNRLNLTEALSAYNVNTFDTITVNGSVAYGKSGYLLKAEPVNITITGPENYAYETNTTGGNDTGIIMNLPLDEGAGTITSDGSGMRNNGTLYNESTICAGGDCPQWVSGKFGGALQFDGKDDYVLVKNSESLNQSFTSITLSFWFKTPISLAAQADNVAVLGKIGIAAYDYVVGVGTTEIMGFAAANNTGSSQSVSTIGFAPALNRWYYVTGVFNSTHLLIYIDGTLNNSAAFVGTAIQASTKDFAIGGGYLVKFFNGTIDEVRFYNRSMSAEEIYQQYIAGEGKYNKTFNVGTHGNYSVSVVAAGANYKGYRITNFTVNYTANLTVALNVSEIKANQMLGINVTTKNNDNASVSGLQTNITLLDSGGTPILSILNISQSHTALQNKTNTTSWATTTTAPGIYYLRARSYFEGKQVGEANQSFQINETRTVAQSILTNATQYDGVNKAVTLNAWINRSGNVLLNGTADVYIRYLNSTGIRYEAELNNSGTWTAENLSFTDLFTQPIQARWNTEHFHNGTYYAYVSFNYTDEYGNNMSFNANNTFTILPEWNATFWYNYPITTTYNWADTFSNVTVTINNTGNTELCDIADECEIFIKATGDDEPSNQHTFATTSSGHNPGWHVIVGPIGVLQTLSFTGDNKQGFKFNTDSPIWVSGNHTFNTTVHYDNARILENTTFKIDILAVEGTILLKDSSGSIVLGNNFSSNEDITFDSQWKQDVGGNAIMQLTHIINISKYPDTSIVIKQLLNNITLGTSTSWTPSNMLWNTAQFEPGTYYANYYITKRDNDVPLYYNFSTINDTIHPFEFYISPINDSRVTSISVNKASNYTINENVVISGATWRRGNIDFNGILDITITGPDGIFALSSCDRLININSTINASFSCTWNTTNSTSGIYNVSAAVKWGASNITLNWTLFNITTVKAVQVAIDSDKSSYYMDENITADINITDSGNVNITGNLTYELDSESKTIYLENYINISTASKAMRTIVWNLTNTLWGNSYNLRATYRYINASGNVSVASATKSITINKNWNASANIFTNSTNYIDHENVNLTFNITTAGNVHYSKLDYTISLNNSVGNITTASWIPFERNTTKQASYVWNTGAWPDGDYNATLTIIDPASGTIWTTDVIFQIGIIKKASITGMRVNKYQQYEHYDIPDTLYIDAGYINALGNANFTGNLTLEFIKQSDSTLYSTTTCAVWTSTDISNCVPSITISSPPWTVGRTILNATFDYYNGSHNVLATNQTTFQIGTTEVTIRATDRQGETKTSFFKNDVVYIHVAIKNTSGTNVSGIGAGNITSATLSGSNILGDIANWAAVLGMPGEYSFNIGQRPLGEYSLTLIAQDPFEASSGLSNEFSFEVKEHWIITEVVSEGTSPIISNSKKYSAANSLNSTVMALVHQGTRFEEVSTALNTMTLNQMLEGNKMYLVFTNGNWQTIQGRMEDVISGAFEKYINPSFGFPLLDTNRITVGIEYGDKGINVTGNMKLSPGLYTFVITNEGMENGKTIIGIKRKS